MTEEIIGRERPVVSVLVPTFNSGVTVKGALDALVACPAVKEVLIADGGSRDRTLEILRSYDGDRVKIISTSDKGLYDGANKLLAHITGRYVLFMNSDDIANAEYIEGAITLLTKGHDFVFGDIIYGGKLRQPRFTKPPKFYKAIQLMPFPHVSLIMGADLFRAVGSFDLRYKIAADLDFVNRLLAMTSNGVYLSKPAASCEPNGLSSGNKQVYESCHIAVKHGRSPIVAGATALAVYFYRKTVIPVRKCCRI